jgi:hypothetical protein
MQFQRGMSAVDPLRKSHIPFCCGAQDGSSRINNVVGCCPRPERKANEATGLHQSYGKRSGRMARRRARTAVVNATDTPTVDELFLQRGNVEIDRAAQ